MRKLLGLAAVAMLCAALAAGAVQASRKAAVKVTFATYVWQPSTVAANNAIVAAWNKSHPDIQVEVVPVDVNSVHDKLLTSFVGGTAADIIHDEAADIAGFIGQGYLADMTPLISKKLYASIPRDTWQTVNFSRKLYGVPSLIQTYNVFANMDILNAAGIKPPTADAPWTWDRFREVAKQLTTSDRFGVCWGVKTPAAAIQTLGLNFGAQFMYLVNGRWEFKWGAAEQKVPTQIHDMMYVDKSLDPAMTGVNTTGSMASFLGRKCALAMGGNFLAQQISSQGPTGFKWAQFPLLKGDSQYQVANPQTYSISQQSQHKAEAAQFIEYLVNAQNLSALGQGDWLIPASPAAAADAIRTTGFKGVWRVNADSTKYFRKGNWVSLAAYARWKSEVAQPNFVQYLKNQITLDQLGANLTAGWLRVRG